ncbi:hypothetical protein HRR83_007368 [Exophiala dermatitidis]|uniref:Uncharacterized protein n=1 Tax=Exophiala dermatitidis TaxID=5970 RepID=A0AAN6EPE2_EXODE|nr:hypothetical protein HRR74_006814 [Exophiala dermatitidis]KAJ4510722.1 hypothetical protein HRR73_006794 [Exophiala dermatitidis]KAJ4534950.1 hypothetical protein HRR76_006852 [Exophiala dermatitidis]KAJ4536019.1 hypothetical protein HRR77_007465 [Exophiala dermatitidis]KAJ4571034.1 hypothetical protein HRR79_003949 [Exophiala dermatitidis]
MLLKNCTARSGKRRRAWKRHGEIQLCCASARKQSGTVGGWGMPSAGGNDLVSSLPLASILQQASSYREPCTQALSDGLGAKRDGSHIPFTSLEDAYTFSIQPAWERPLNETWCFVYSPSSRNCQGVCSTMLNTWSQRHEARYSQKALGCS